MGPTKYSMSSRFMGKATHQLSEITMLIILAYMQRIIFKPIWVIDINRIVCLYSFVNVHNIAVTDRVKKEVKNLFPNRWLKGVIKGIQSFCVCVCSKSCVKFFACPGQLKGYSRG